MTKKTQAYIAIAMGLIIIGLLATLIVMIIPKNPKLEQEEIAADGSETTTVNGELADTIVEEEIAIVFKDKEFEKMLRIALDNKDGDIFQSDLDEITKIRIYGDTHASVNDKQTWSLDYLRNNVYVVDGVLYRETGKISSLEDINLFANLKDLDIKFNNVSDISYLEQNSELKNVDVSNDKISDISSLKKINNLESVNITGNSLVMDVENCLVIKELINTGVEVINNNYLSKTIAASTSHSAGLKKDGTVVVAGKETNNGKMEVDEWTDIVAVDIGNNHTVGLKADGTVVAVGSNSRYGQCDTGEWKNIIDICAGGAHTVGLKADGTLTAIGQNRGQIDIWEWEDIVAVDAVGTYTIGVKSDGTVIPAYSYDYYSRKYDIYELLEWTDVVDVAAGDKHTVGLKSDGTVYVIGTNTFGECELEDWTDIVAIAAGEAHTVGLKSDGTVLAAGWTKNGRCNVEEWSDIVAIDAGKDYTLGLKADGTVLAVGNNSDRQCNVLEWMDIGLPE